MARSVRPAALPLYKEVRELQNRRGKKRFVNFGYKRRLSLWGLGFAFPALLFFSFFFVYPIFRTFIMSFYSWNILEQPRYIGLSNYKTMAGSQEFLQSLQVTVYYVLGTVVPILMLALPAALLFNCSFFGKDAFLATWYLPVIIPFTVVAILWRLMYNPTYGFLTLFTSALGLENVRWLSDAKLAMPALNLLSVWRAAPYYMVILLAGLGSIPKDYYEAARIDGANGWRIFWGITLPLLQPVMLYVVVISIISTFQVFVLPYVMTQGGPGAATRVLPFYIYQNAFDYLRMGYACAVSFVLFLILLILTAAQLRLFGFGKEV